MELKYITRNDSDVKGKPKVLLACHPEDHEYYFDIAADDVLEHANCSVWYDPEGTYGLGEVDPAGIRILRQMIADENYPERIRKSGNRGGRPDYANMDRRRSSNAGTGGYTPEHTEEIIRNGADIGFGRRDTEHKENSKSNGSAGAGGDVSVYPKEYCVLYSELELVLDEFQLVVIPVTCKFLYKDNIARDVILPFARKERIAILPIMLEPDLALDFNKICATVQIVDRCSNDPTATPYDEVLENFLGSVLIGDDLAARVRDAFDAYVFLSYRKKDRRHAKRLMHLIHDNPEFRDIAIWYDEYLVPGEDFNDAIRDAFNKSSLFALTVTPSLLEQGNYVMEVEYPLAHERKKSDEGWDIVPVEMYQEERGDPRTDMEKLGNNYKEMPVVRDEHDVPVLNAAFLDALSRMSRKPNDGSTRHKFFIGLAYLNGIDVEADHAKGARLLIETAEDPKDPFVDAADKLVDMYLHGDGVPVNTGEAIRWQRRAAELYRQAYEKDHDPDNHKGYGTKYFKALVRLSDLLRDNGDTKEAVKIAHDALTFADKLEEEVGVREMDRDRAIVLNRLGRIAISGRDYDNAERYYLGSKRIYEKLSGEIGTARARRDLSISYERLGDICRKRRDIAGAEEYYLKTMRIREELDIRYPSHRARRDLSAVYTKLGNIGKDRGDPGMASDFFEKALVIDEDLAGELRTDQAIDDWSVSMIKKADIFRKQGKADDASALYLKAEKVLADLADRTGSRRHRRNYAALCGKIASALKRSAGSTSADVDEYYLKAVRFRETLFEDFPSDESSGDLAKAYYNLALFRSDKEIMSRAEKLWKNLAARDHHYTKYLEKAREYMNK